MPPTSCFDGRGIGSRRWGNNRSAADGWISSSGSEITDCDEKEQPDDLDLGVAATLSFVRVATLCQSASRFGEPCHRVVVDLL